MSFPTAPESCLELLQAMVRCDTITPRTSGRPLAESQLGKSLVELARAWGLEAQFLPVPDAAPNVLLTHVSKPTAPWVLFDSHLDTVGVQHMTIAPFAAEVREGRLYGRGACDTKGTGAAMLWALKQAVQVGGTKANIALLFTVGEEARQVGARAFLENDLANLSWMPTAVIVGEPTQMRVVNATNGYVRFNLATYGQATHSSTPEQGHNAISDMARAIVAIEDKYIARLEASHPLTGRSTCSINVVRGGNEHNVVPERCVATVDHRLTPGQDCETALAGIRAAIAPLAEQSPKLDCRIEDIEYAPPFAPELNGPLGERTAEILGQAGVRSTILGAPYTTNANHYAGHKLPAIVLGPGDIAQAHTRDEWIALDQLELGVQGYLALMKSPWPCPVN